jgi:hypothetical protein
MPTNRRVKPAESMNITSCLFPNDLYMMSDKLLSLSVVCNRIKEAVL